MKVTVTAIVTVHRDWCATKGVHFKVFLGVLEVSFFEKMVYLIFLFELSSSK